MIKTIKEIRKIKEIKENKARRSCFRNRIYLERRTKNGLNNKKKTKCDIKPKNACEKEKNNVN